MNYFIHIKSLDAGNIYVNGTFVGLIDNEDTHTIDLKVYSPSLVITKEPISSQTDYKLPFTVVVQIQKDMPPSDLVVLVPYPQNHFDVILKQSVLHHQKPLNKIYESTFDDISVIGYDDGQTTLSLYRNNVLQFATQTTSISSVFCEAKNDYLVAKGATHDGDTYVLIVSKTTLQPILEDVFEKVEDTPKDLTLLKSLQDIAKHGSVQVFDYETGQLQKPYYVYLKNNAAVTTQAPFIPLAFLQAVQVGNFILAKQYLTERLTNSNYEQNLQSFFPDMKSIHYNAYQTNPSVVNYSVLCGDSFKNFDFTIQNNKIDEIEQITL